jgi:hypothetical protein
MIGLIKGKYHVSTELSWHSCLALYCGDGPGVNFAGRCCADQRRAALLAAYLGLWLLVARNIELGPFIDSWKVRVQPDTEPTEVAREAVARARSDPNYDSLVRLLDIGLIVDEQRPDGMALRRGRFISLDDDAIRPFVIIHVPDVLAGRLSHIRFELLDSSNQLRYVFEDEKWLQSGENTLLPDYRFPVRKKASELEAGGWSARLIVDRRDRRASFQFVARAAGSPP